MQLYTPGNAEDLDKLKIPVKLDLPGVGENLQDHLELYIQHYSKKVIRVVFYLIITSFHRFVTT